MHSRSWLSPAVLAYAQIHARSDTSQMYSDCHSHSVSFKKGIRTLRSSGGSSTALIALAGCFVLLLIQLLTILVASDGLWTDAAVSVMCAAQSETPTARILCCCRRGLAAALQWAAVVRSEAALDAAIPVHNNLLEAPVQGAPAGSSCSRCAEQPKMRQTLLLNSTVLRYTPMRTVSKVMPCRCRLSGRDFCCT
jgi:hypothetical protein